MNFRQAMEYQAQFCENSGAPITARVCRALAEAIDSKSATGARALGWTGNYIADAVPLRLVAPFHFLFRKGSCVALDPLFRGEDCDDVAAIHRAIAEHDAEILPWLDGPPQTNEAARSATFMAALLVLADRFGHEFELFEIGSSAGLNLLIDRYRYDLGGVSVGPADSRIVIRPEWKGPPPPNASIRISSLQGVDIAPIDVRDAAAAERLLAYVWIDQKDRFARTEAAIEMIKADGPHLEKGDAADFVEASLSKPQTGETTRVLLHSIVWQYLPEETQQRITTAMEAAGAKATVERPLAWIAFEADRTLKQHTVRLRIWPGNTDSVVGLAHPHASWIIWSSLQEAS
ncbi:DUF2332 family protein [Sphingomonas paeninsulae]|uniref:DUF2332 family protein n=1 Tax=Sphingomonas paeninsulae TaxID=2319844 RepID=A0A494TAL6_SPHPE|nr:DUF2332 family protein [Sphingomonas paeninsulae]AYJ86489.1 DUF2332 family protein [Sphingomonas paeninsulae]